MQVMMKNRRPLSDLLFLVIISFLAIASIVSYLRLTSQNNASNLVLHNNLVRSKLGLLLTYSRETVKDMQDSVSRNDSAFLNQWQKDSAGLFLRIKELDSLTQDEKDQRNRITQFGNLYSTWLKNLKEIRFTKLHITGNMQDYILTSDDFLKRAQILITDIRHAEDDALYEKVQEKDRSAFFTPFYSLILSFLAIVFVGIAYFRLRNETRLRMKAEDGQAVIHNFFQQAPAMLAILKGPDHRFEFVNPAYRELIGGRDPINKPVREAVPEVAGQGYYEILDSVYQTGIPFIGKEMPLQIDRGRGLEQIYINFIYQSLKNTMGEAEGILVFCYDVSELVTARNLLQQSESRTRLAIEAARMGTFDWDLQNQQFISSPRMKEIFGFAENMETTHRDLISRFHPDDKVIRDFAVEKSLTTGSLIYEIRIIWPDDSIHWINVYGKILSDDARNLLRMYGTAVDITPQKIALEELKESESKFRLLANTMPQLIWTAGKEGSLNYFNQAVFDYSGLGFEEIEKQGWLSIVHPDDREENVRQWMESVRTGKEFIFEHRFRNFNEEYRWQLSRAVPQKDEQGNIQMWIGTSTDIQDQKHFMQELEKKVFERTQSLNYANLALKQSVSELEQTNAELASFNYIASHDLQEPLRKIIAFSKRIEDVEMGTLSETSRDYFTRIIQAASRMQNLIDAFLSYSQTSNPRAEMRNTDLSNILDEVKNELSDIMEQKRVSLKSHALPSVTGIPIQIQQLFTNLIGNAIKYKRPDLDPEIEIWSEKVKGMNLEIEGVDKNTDYWKINIKDNGIGFEQVHENQIFELFQRLHSRQEFEGTGIGLAICKKIMRNHQGFISALGKSGSGAVFSMYFPV